MQGPRSPAEGRVRRGADRSAAAHRCHSGIFHSCCKLGIGLLKVSACLWATTWPLCCGHQAVTRKGTWPARAVPTECSDTDLALHEPRPDPGLWQQEVTGTTSIPTLWGCSRALPADPEPAAGHRGVPEALGAGRPLACLEAGPGQLARHGALPQGKAAAEVLKSRRLPATPSISTDLPNTLKRLGSRCSLPAPVTAQRGPEAAPPGAAGSGLPAGPQAGHRCAPGSCDSESMAEQTPQWAAGWRNCKDLLQPQPCSVLRHCSHQRRDSQLSSFTAQCLVISTDCDSFHSFKEITKNTGSTITKPSYPSYIVFLLAIQINVISVKIMIHLLLAILQVRSGAT